MIPKIRFFLRRNHLYCHITLNKKRTKTAFSTGIPIKPNAWDSRNQYVRADKAANALLEKVKSDLVAKFFTLKEPTAETLKAAFLKHEEPANMSDLIDDYLKTLERKVKNNLIKPQSVSVYHAKLKHLATYIKAKNIVYIDQFKRPQAYELFEQLQDHMEPISIRNCLTEFNSFFNYLINKELTVFNPFRGISIFTPKKDLVYMTKEEVDRMAALDLEGDTKIVRDEFLFMSLTALGFADMKKLDYQTHYQLINEREWLVVKRQKTKKKGSIQKIPLLPRALALWKAYNFDFPKMSYSKFRKHLPIIMQAAKIDKKITSHKGRHTVGMGLLASGVSIESVSSVLGHADIGTTQAHYTEISLAKIDAETKHLRVG